jgi:signal transduction histidine kinase
MNRTVLFVDDDANLLEAMARNMRKTDYQVLTADTLDQANHLLQTHQVDAVVSDAKMPGVTGTEFLSKVAHHYPDIARIILTGHPSVPLATEAINQGKVCHFLTKPCNTLALVEILNNALDERDRANEKLAQAQKMGALGQLTIGIVHDFNNLLTVIKGGSEIVLRNMDEKDPWCDTVADIHEAGDRAADLTGRLLAFSRQEKAQTIVFCPNQIVANMEKILARVLGNNIELKTVLGPDLPSVCTDPRQLEQALLNLAVNARDAMPKGGKLTITTSANCSTGPHIPNDNADSIQAPYVTIRVSDTGVGMNEDTRKRVLQPFFTTKERGHGTGLGLAMVNDFVGQARGFMEVESSPGRGATFTLQLPAVV